jgi:hypothetical protein
MFTIQIESEKIISLVNVEVIVSLETNVCLSNAYHYEIN